MLRSLFLGCLLAVVPVVVIPSQVAASSGGTTSGPSTLIGLGATTAQWNAHHSVNKRAGGFGTWGPFVPIPGEGGSGPVEWEGSPANGRMVGFDYEMPGDPNLAKAQRLVLMQLPPDATPASPMWKLSDSSGHTCLVWNLTSAQLGKVLAPSPWDDRAGNISVRLMSEVGRDELQLSKSGDGIVRLTKNNIDFAVLSIQTVGRYSSCTTILNG